jgi:O-antigen/teichoic acid export membrane protein
MVSNMAIFALNFSDRFFLQHLRSLEMVGIYAIGYKFGFMINYLLVQPFTMMWQTRMYLVGDRSDHPAVFKRVFVSYSVLLIYGGLAVSVLSPEIITFMVDRRFAGSQNVIPLIALSYIFYGMSMYFQTGLLLTNRTRIIGLVGLAAAALNLVLNYFLILRFGIFGAAWTTVLSFAAIAVGNYWQSQRALRLRLGMGGIALALITSIGIYLLSRWWAPPSWEVGLAVKLLVLTALPLLAWKTGGLRRSGIGWFVEPASGRPFDADIAGR